MAKTKIEWADKVWNPVTGCTKVNEGCWNCYAERMAKRLVGRCGYPAAPDQFKVTLHHEKLEEPLHWKKQARIFVDSMGDLFHQDVPDTFISQVFWIMMMAPKHTFMILTKRPKRMMDWVNKDYQNPLPNVWLGVSVENQKVADERIPSLLKTPAAVRFVSVEPMLEKISLWFWLDKCSYYCDHGDMWPEGHRPKRSPIDWVICGCESGPGARPMEMSWAADLKHQCVMTRVPFFCKQAKIDGKLVKMPKIDGRIWDEFPG